MIITGMAHYESVCKKKLVEWYHKNRPGVEIDRGDVFIVWSCKTLQNYKCLVSTTISGDGIYAEYTYNSDAKCRGIFIKCQARHCKKEFEIKINQDK